MEIKKLPASSIPKILMELPQPPKELWIRGQLPKGNMTYLAVVGSRKFTSYGKEACQRIISGLRGYPIIIVSGLALGMDAIAHESALSAGLCTVAFPGSGLSESAIHPKTNIWLSRKIVESGGCLISEHEPNFRATHWSFAERNRLMAGISKATLIVEAEERSGTLITARLTTDYNRELLAVPGSIFSPNSKGTNKLIRQGATPVTSAENVLEALGFEPSAGKQKSLFDLSPREQMVIKLLREPLPRDELTEALGMTISEVNSLLSVMEIKELIKEEYGELKSLF